MASNNLATEGRSVIHVSKIIDPKTANDIVVVSLRPPNPPWRALEPSEHAGGYLSFYFSDDLSALPVRWVTKPGDNKSDPNLETCTYGLFSTCNRAMRAGVVKNSSPYIFFITQRNGKRMLSGYYHIGWFTEGILQKNDFCLAADNAHFVSTLLPLSSVDDRIGTTTSTKFRLSKYVSFEHCQKLKALLDSFPNVMMQYLAEIDRLEKFNLKHGGYRYIAWRQADKFSWDYAEKYIGKKLKYKAITDPTNSSSSDLWECQRCGEITKNKALLKLCPYCKEPGVLYPYA